MADIEITPEQQEKIDLIRLLLGDIPKSAFYPILTDEEYCALLDMYDWDVRRAVRRSAFSILFYLSQVNFRERTGDIEVWQNASQEYRKALENLVSVEEKDIPSDLRPWVAGGNKYDVCRINNDPRTNRHPLAMITSCMNWWTRVDRYDCLGDTTMGMGRGGGCG